MSSSTTGRRETAGIVADALRRPMQDAIREGVREAMKEQEGRRSESRGERSSGHRRSSGGWRSGGDEGGSGRSRFALLVLLGVGMAAVLLWRRQNAGPGGPGGMTQSIREQAKGGQSGPDGAETTSGPTETGGGAIEPSKEDIETEDAAPGAGSE